MTGILKRDLVAGLPLYHADDGRWLGVSMGPAVGDLVDVLDESNPDESVKRSVPWRDVRIGHYPPE